MSMLEPQLIGVGARHLERLVIALAGALAVWLGYRLFINMPLGEKGTGKLQLPGGISIFISRVGPGVFFVLFGAGVLAYGLHQAVRIEVNAPSAVTTSDTPAASSPRRPTEVMAAAPSPSAAPPLSSGAPSPTFDGVFDGRMSDRTGALPARTVLRRQGDRVSGVYSYGAGQGEIVGIVEGDTLIFVWQSGGSRGRGRVRTSPGGVEFEGTWGYGDASAGGGTWTGARRGR
jgi:hypothetical protein